MSKKPDDLTERLMACLEDVDSNISDPDLKAGIMRFLSWVQETDFSGTPDESGVEEFFPEGLLPEKYAASIQPALFRFFDSKNEGKSWLDDIRTDRKVWYAKSPDLAICHMVIRKTHAAAKQGDADSRDFLLAFYKKLHKTESKQLRRFRRLSASDVYALLKDGRRMDEYMCPENVARVLGMAGLMDIPMDDECAVFFELLNDQAKDREESYRAFLKDFNEDKKTSAEKVRPGLSQQITNWFLHNDKVKLSQTAIAMQDLAQDTLNIHGYGDEYLVSISDKNATALDHMLRGWLIMYLSDPDRTYTRNEVEMSGIVYSLAAALATETSRHKESILALAKAGDWDAGSGEDDSQEDTGADSSLQEDLAASKRENQELSRGLAAKTTECERLAEQCHGLEQANEKLEQRLKAQEEASAAEHDELIHLREFVHKIEIGPDSMTDLSMDEMVQALAGKRVTVIGGHQNWFRKLQKRFPDWKLVASESYRVVDGKMLDGSDMVYFFTDHMGHVAYEKFIAAVRERNIPFGYLGTINMEQVITQVYEDLCEK